MVSNLDTKIRLRSFPQFSYWEVSGSCKTQVEKYPVPAKLRLMSFRFLKNTDWGVSCSRKTQVEEYLVPTKHRLRSILLPQNTDWGLSCSRKTQIWEYLVPENFKLRNLRFLPIYGFANILIVWACPSHRRPTGGGLCQSQPLSCTHRHYFSGISLYCSLHLFVFGSCSKQPT